MKKLAGLLLSLLMMLSSASAEGWYTIADLYEQTPIHWTQTYETQWRTVNIDAVIAIPDVSSIPVMLIENLDEFPQLKTEDPYWNELYTRGAFDLRWNNSWPEYPSKLDGRHLDSQQTSGTNLYSGIEADGCYVPMSETTYGEICSLVDDTLIQYGLDPEMYAYRTPFRLWSQHMFFYGKKEDALPGTVFASFRTKFSGIPVLSHVQTSVGFNQRSRDDEFFVIPDNSLVYQGYGERLGGLSLWCAKPAEVLAEDVPLCSFEAIRTALEEEILSGRIRKIYEIELGYVLYNEPGQYHTAKPGKERVAESAAARYYLRPMWQVNCLYKDSATGKLRSQPTDSDDERNTLDYYQLLIDAQTGEVVHPSSAKDRCEYKGFISWDAVP